MAKVMTSILVEVMDNLISLNKSDFLKGRLLVDRVVVLKELVDQDRKSKRFCLILRCILIKHMIQLTGIL